MFLTRGGERWPASKVQDTHPRFRRPKPYGPVALSCASHEALAERALFRANGGAPECLTSGGQGPKGPEKGESTGGCAEQAYNHRVRDVEALTNLRLSLSGSPSCREARWLRGFLGARRPARPRIISGRAPH